MDELNTSNFSLVIAEVFQIKGRGTVVTGTVDTGRVSIGDTLCLTDASENILSKNIKIRGLDIGFSRIRPQTAEEGMNVGLFIGDVDIAIESSYILKNL